MKELESSEVKKELIKLGRHVIEVLDENEIPYVIYYGTLLGAIRHNGFIPWDDDFDIVIPAEHQYKLRKIFTKKDCKYWSSNDGNYYDWVPRLASTCIFVENNKTPWSVYNHTFSENNVGLCIDIYPVMNLPTKGISKYIYKMINYLDSRLYKYSFKFKSSKLKSIANLLYVIKCSIPGNTYYFDRHLRRRFNKDLFNERVKVKFDDMSVYAPKNSKKELEEIYGDWKKIPSKKEIESSIHYNKVFKLGD